MKAAEKGYAPAQLIVSRYLDGKGEFHQALDWLKRALAQLFPGETNFARVSPEYKNLTDKIMRGLK